MLVIGRCRLQIGQVDAGLEPLLREAHRIGHRLVDAGDPEPLCAAPGGVARQLDDCRRPTGARARAAAATPACRARPPVRRRAPAASPTAAAVTSSTTSERISSSYAASSGRFAAAADPRRQSVGMDGPDRQQHVAAFAAASRRSSMRAPACRRTSTRSPRRSRRAAGARADHALASRSRQRAAGAEGALEGPRGRRVRARSPVPAGDGVLEIVPTPGHSPDHLCFFDRESGDLYCGDLARLRRHHRDSGEQGRRPARVSRLAAPRPRARAAPPAARTRPDHRRPDRAHRRLHRAPRAARTADPESDPRRRAHRPRDRPPRLPGAARRR